MGGVSIIFANGDTLKLDATFSQGHERSADVATHPVENGADIADHVRPKPYQLSIRALQSYAPIVPPGQSPEANRHVKAFNRLQRAIDNSEIVKVSTGLKLYSNMAMKLVGADQTKATGFDVPLDIEFIEIRFTTSATTTVPKDAIGKSDPAATPAVAKKQVRDTQDMASARKEKGPVSKGNLTKPQEAQAESLLFKLAHGKLF